MQSITTETDRTNKGLKDEGGVLYTVNLAQGKKENAQAYVAGFMGKVVECQRARSAGA